MKHPERIVPRPFVGVRVVASWISVWVLAFACTPGPETDTESWFHADSGFQRPCAVDEDCSVAVAGSVCEDGYCTAGCRDDGDCRYLFGNVVQMICSNPLGETTGVCALPCGGDADCCYENYAGQCREARCRGEFWEDDLVCDDWGQPGTVPDAGSDTSDTSDESDADVEVVRSWFNEPCADDDTCRQLGGPDARCIQEICTSACSQDTPCDEILGSGADFRCGSPDGGAETFCWLTCTASPECCFAGYVSECDDGRCYPGNYWSSGDACIEWPPVVDSGETPLELVLSATALDPNRIGDGVAISISGPEYIGRPEGAEKYETTLELLVSGPSEFRWVFEYDDDDQVIKLPYPVNLNWTGIGADGIRLPDGDYTLQPRLTWVGRSTDDEIVDQGTVTGDSLSVALGSHGGAFSSPEYPSLDLIDVCNFATHESVSTTELLTSDNDFSHSTEVNFSEGTVACICYTNVPAHFGNEANSIEVEIDGVVSLRSDDLAGGLPGPGIPVCEEIGEVGNLAAQMTLSAIADSPTEVEVVIRTANIPSDGTSRFLRSRLGRWFAEDLVFGFGAAPPQVTQNTEFAFPTFEMSPSRSNTVEALRAEETTIRHSYIIARASDGQVVRRVPLVDVPVDTFVVAPTAIPSAIWDLRNDQGTHVADGEYIVVYAGVESVDTGGQETIIDILEFELPRVTIAP